MPVLRGTRITLQRFMTALNLAVACVTEQVNSTTVHPSHARCVRKAITPKKGTFLRVQFVLLESTQIRQGLEGVQHATLTIPRLMVLPQKANVFVYVLLGCMRR
jgi:hypothetical protein